MNVSQPVASAVKGVEFGFLSSGDIRALSVKRVTNPTTFDTLLNPIPGGLYDSAYGPFGDNGCSTCNLKHGCPGHCGHIELPVHVYHPTFMDQCLRLLRAKCVYCHKLRLARSEVNRYVCKLRLIKHGLIKESYDVDEIKAGKGKDALLTNGAESASGSDSEDADVSAVIDKRNAFTRRALKSATKPSEWTSQKLETVVDERRETIREFLGTIANIRKCTSCGGISPKYRKDRFTKIFKKPLTERDRVTMVQAGLKEQDPLVLLKKQRAAAAAADKKRALAEDEGVADLEDSTTESEGEGDDIEMLDIEQEVAGGTTLETSTSEKSKKSSTSDPDGAFLNAGQVHAALVQLFEREEEIFQLVYSPSQRKGSARPSADMFFIKDLLIPPNKYRPEARTSNDSIAESPDNTHYKNILSVCDDMSQIHKEINGIESAQQGRRLRTYADFQNAWIKLQDAVNSMLDRDRNPVQPAPGRRIEDGIKQRLEKKEGLFRKNMMGKRVNFAARTVISPDPNIETNEIGVPPVFAIKLTYPEPVTDHNFHDLKEAVINGPYVWPGAVAIENENGQVINLQIKNAEERTALANQLQAPSSTSVTGGRPKKVHRHLNNGDIVIMNRQPTLHKPSMMCHRARVLPGEKTLRMHYANCKTYNADFDGDEMNMHFPQNELARSEAINIADTDHQFLSATFGEPLRGLIQDHISMGVHLTNRDTFFDRDEYQQLIYAAVRPENNHTSSGRIETVPPTIFKPKPLWTGKQVISTILKNIKPENYPGLTLQSKSTTLKSLWADNSEEQEVIFKDGELVCGIIDKKQIGPSSGGLVDAIYEAYGHTAAGKLLSILGRLLTKLLHMRAFSCGIEDLVFTPAGDIARRKHLEQADHFGLQVAAEYVSLSDRKPSTNDAELRKRLEEVLRDPEKQQGLDGRMKGAAGEVSTDVTKNCLPSALVKPFPKNQMQAMTVSGAKGSKVNANQISCNLGQQVLEGNRVPVMVSGKTLPCFKPFETSARAGGYIVDRFLTGVRPQEYYFHAMAGREGLIDTAVKTSRSGYLQRCLCKGLEGLRVEHDSSVRNPDGSVVQFIYGDDGLDVTKAKYTSAFKFLGENYVSFFYELALKEDFERVQNEDAQEHTKKAEKLYRKTGDLGCMDPALAIYPPSSNAGSMSESLFRAAREWMEKNPDGLIKEKKSEGGTLTKIALNKATMTKKTFQRLLEMRYAKSVVEAGEAVGVVAGQSVGEPSTQMTLNTFHLAGHAAKNVTLGIPRLREIVMTASQNIPTPTMMLYLNEEIGDDDARQFAKGISQLSLAEITDNATVTERIGKGVGYEHARQYTVHLDFFPSDEYCEEYAITVRDVVNTLEKKFFPRLQASLRKEIKKSNDMKTLKGKVDAHPEIGKSAGTIEQESSRAGAEHEGGDDDSDDEGDDDATRDKVNNNKKQSGYDAPDDDEEELINRESTSDESEDETYGGSPRPSKRSRSNNDQDDSSKASSNSSLNVRAIEERIMSSRYSNDVASFTFSTTPSRCTFTIEYEASASKILFLPHLESALHQSLIQTIPGVKSATYIPANNLTNEPASIITEGANLLSMREFQDVLNPHKMRTNDIGLMLRLYGVEACRASIVAEIGAVFGGHGIDVDYRHLSLIADFMTRSGGYRAFNRQGFAGNASPLMKMSFETTVGFLKDAVLEADTDELVHPSARGVIGRVGRMGTGAFEVLVPVKPWGEEGQGRNGVEILARKDEEDEDEMDVDEE
ncbi:beta and beta-prime subunits of DNA dependent RNA-polymerase [Myriangium duriaei CBS 260.36]|uniref:DNA-directed RNA polymerase subunit n=1 Tax=Myriangium duriaei CBS 260.36 TaxID=1168546 RepID=A0A9P4MSV5_9PEZI|nr:beta and beta-prime subunits of DNA dependent RNA-polymerase [Myriangium duriaei CBS 260.36]